MTKPALCILCLVVLVLSTLAQRVAPVTTPGAHTLSPSLLHSHATDSSKRQGSIVGYPGVLSKEYVHSRVDEELRAMILRWRNSVVLEPVDGTGETKASRKRARKPGQSASIDSRVHKLRSKHNRSRRLKDDDFSGLNDILESFSFEIPEQVIQQELLGATATFVIKGECGGISVDEIKLDYDIDKDDLLYDVTVEGLDVDCEFEAQFDFGIYDIEDDLTIDVNLRNNDFEIGVVLEGVPPESSSFQGCEAVIGIKDIDANGGFSANILNDLDYLVIEIVDSETETISDILCEQVAQFTSVVDGVVLSVVDLLEPYLGGPRSVDPLELEKDLQAEEELVDFTDSDLGYAITVIVDNLQGVVGPYQINTLIELNLLDEDGSFVIDLTQEEEEDNSREDDDRRQLQSDQDECSIVRRRHRNLLEQLVVPESLLMGRMLQFGGGEEELFTVNSLDVLTIEVKGLNSFDHVDLLEIIGKHTFRTRLEVSAISVKATVLLNADINDVNIEETIEVTLPIEDTEVVISYLVGLKASVVESTGLATLLNPENLSGCLFSALEAFGVSEMSVSVGELGIPVIEGVLDSGVDELINTAVEAAVIAYQELIVDEAIPNIFQKNVTVAVNEFAECTIRTESATAVCPTQEETEDDDSLTDDLFRRLQQWV
ncbi:expressed unknown protein [Seminavis robusta]|uniref:Uncharacterized protein n=1 Tax=Seminavis robusta TaxID=568900 RepID=A0A9N8E4E7_9STRA|nr:expressed unknown protein [Seminavis robusta]|eukprot:Sro511_g157430.1 n/a (659) ;mRNA; r:28237-30213